MHHFFKLSSDYLSKTDREEIKDYVTAAGVLSSQKIETYLMLEFSRSVPMSMRQFENLARNIFNYPELHCLKEDFVEFMSVTYLKDTFQDYFRHIVLFDKKRFAVESLYSPDLDIVIAIVNRIVYHVSHDYRQEDALQFLRVLAKDTSIKYHLLLCYLGEQYYERGDKVRVLLMMDRLEPSDKYELLAMSLYRKSLIWEEAENALADDRFFEYAKNIIKDDDMLCRAIRSEVYGDFFGRNHRSGSHLLMRLMIENPENIPETLEYILQYAINNSQFDTVIQLGSCFPKKRILEIIASQNNTDLLDKFFFLYKNYPEVKKLAPFI